MMHDSPPRIDPVLTLARNQMERVKNIHVAHLAIVSGKDETQVITFDEASQGWMFHEDIPALIREIRALGVIVSSPAPCGGRYGAVVTLIDRALESFYAPMVRTANAETMVGDFRPTPVTNANLYERIYAELCVNWLRKHNG